MQFTPQQDQALCAAGRWLREGGNQVFRLFGYAGTGKTTLAKHLAEHGEAWWADVGPDGGRSAGEGRQGGMKRGTMVPG